MVGERGFEPLKVNTNGFLPIYNFHCQLMLFVGWTLPSSGLDAPRQVSTPSFNKAWLGIAIL